MASDPSMVQYIVDQMQPGPPVRFRKMFGEYGIYCNEKIVALVCDNRLFVKPTAAGRAYIGDVVEAPPYASAKPSFLIEDQIDDREWLSELIRVTELELPPMKKRKKKS